MSDTPELLHNDFIIQALANLLAQGKGIDFIPGHIEMVIENKMWERRIVEVTGQYVTFTTFEEFVEARPPEGLGTTLDRLEKICKDTPAESLLKGQIKQAGKQAPPKGNSNAVKNKDGITMLVSNITDNTANYKLARLKRDDPALAERVISGELSAHAAAVEAGFANPKVSINLRDLNSAARTICRKLDRDEVLELIDWLYKELGGDS